MNHPRDGIPHSLTPPPSLLKGQHFCFPQMMDSWCRLVSGTKHVAACFQPSMADLKEVANQGFVRNSGSSFWASWAPLIWPIFAPGNGESFFPPTGEEFESPLREVQVERGFLRDTARNPLLYPLNHGIAVICLLCARANPDPKVSPS